MRIAYLILAHNNPLHLKKLIDELTDTNVDIFLHIDKKSMKNFKNINLSNVHVLKNNINVYWGEFSLVHAPLLLLQEAYAYAKYDYFVLLSGVDYPVKSKEYIYSFFRKYNGYQFIDLYKMPLFDKSFDRLDFYRMKSHKIKFYNYFVQRINQLIYKSGIKREYPEDLKKMTLYAGSNWWALDKKCVSYILSYIRNNPDFINFFQNTYIPDEMFFQMIVGNSKLDTKIMNGLTYADWDSNPKPNIINNTHMKIFDKPYYKVTYGNKKKCILFARKFNDKSNEIVKFIKKKYL